MSVELEHDEYVSNLEILVRARTEQLREAVTKVAELTAELEVLKTKSSHPADELATTTQRKPDQQISPAARVWGQLFGRK